MSATKVPLEPSAAPDQVDSTRTVVTGRPRAAVAGKMTSETATAAVNDRMRMGHPFLTLFLTDHEPRSRRDYVKHDHLN
jgi:hypothetical protein